MHPNEVKLDPLNTGDVRGEAVTLDAILHEGEHTPYVDALSAQVRRQMMENVEDRHAERGIRSDKR